MKTLEDYLQMDIVRGEDEASIVVEIYRGTPIMMAGFDPNLTDYEIAEAAFYHKLETENKDRA